MINELLTSLEDNPVIAAVKDKNINSAIFSPVSVIFLMGANISTVAQNIANAHDNGKKVFVHIDLAEGIGKDRSGIEYLKSLGVDGIISTRSALIKAAKELDLMTVKRVFTLDSQGVESAMAEKNDVHTDINGDYAGSNFQDDRVLLACRQARYCGRTYRNKVGDNLRAFKRCGCSFNGQKRALVSLRRIK